MPERPPAEPGNYLRAHGVPLDGLRAASGGTNNRVYWTDTHVLRIGAGTDHAREAAIAEGALRAGVRTARPVAWAADYSIWERLPGVPVRTLADRRVAAGAWPDLLNDLERLHASPPEPVPASLPEAWAGDVRLVDWTQRLAGWSEEERSTIASLLGTHVPAATWRFCHGDAWADNVLVDSDGRYTGLVDWGCAGWQPLEQEASRLEDPALELAVERWPGLDLALCWKMRLEVMLLAAVQRQTWFDDIRDILAQAVSYTNS